MLPVLAAAVAIAAAPAAPRASSVTATASIRIVAPVRLRVGAQRSMEGVPVRDALLRDADGRSTPAKLVEME